MDFKQLMREAQRSPNLELLLLEASGCDVPEAAENGAPIRTTRLFRPQRAQHDEHFLEFTPGRVGFIWPGERQRGGADGFLDVLRC